MAASDTSLRLLQLVGLTLPAIALYMGVLTDIHVVIKRKKSLDVTDLDPPQGSKFSEFLEPRYFNIKYTNAEQQTDFLLCSIGLVMLLAAGFLLLISIVFQSQLLVRLGTGLVAAAYGIVAAGVISTVYLAVRNTRAAE
jgi:hypothetical protein